MESSRSEGKQMNAGNVYNSQEVESLNTQTATSVTTGRLVNPPFGQDWTTNTSTLQPLHAQPTDRFTVTCRVFTIPDVPTMEGYGNEGGSADLRPR